MNRKSIQRKHDISVIIGNLPKRLQTRISESTSILDHAENALNNAGHCRSSIILKALEKVNLEDELPTDIYLQMSCGAEPGLDAIGQESAVTNREVELDLCEEPIIPGILRIKAAAAANQNKSRNNSEERENGHRSSPQLQHCTEMLSVVEQYSPPMTMPVADYPLWFNELEAPCMKQLPELYNALALLIHQKALLENWEKFLQIQIKLLQLFRQLLLQHLKFCCEQKVDAFFWKLIFYNTREYLKKQQSPTSVQCALLDSGVSFYSDLNASLNKKYMNKTTASNKFEFIAKVAAQKILICLGDLNRYKSKLLNTNDYSQANLYYQRASCLIPTNGVPYNQLAIVAIYARNKFDAVYFHMRSLMSSNAIQSARESLLVLFDEIRIKYEETELKSSPEHNRINNQNIRSRNSRKLKKCVRKEVWIHADGMRLLHRTDANESSNSTTIEERLLNNLPADELMRQFTSTYLYVLGKLYTGIGLDSIASQQRKLLLEFKVLLDMDAAHFTRSRLLKIVALNIFILVHNCKKNTRRETRYLAFNFCNQFFGLVLSRCNHLLKNKQQHEYAFCAELITLLQFIKIYTDWLSQNLQIWEPVRSANHTIIDCWKELIEMFERLQCLVLNKNNDISEHIILDEDIFLRGFSPLAATSSNQNSSKVASTDVKQFYARVQKIADFEKCFFASQNFLVMTAATDESYFIFEGINTDVTNALANLEKDLLEHSENPSITSLSLQRSLYDASEFTHSDEVEGAQILQLAKLKKELEAKSNICKMHYSKLEEILNLVDSTIYIQVRPKYLIPDTNCFIDCLEEMQLLLNNFKHYTLIIPLTVVKELDGLAKGAKLELNEKSAQKQRIHHYDDVTSCAQKSLEFIKSAKSNIKCATTKGSIINASLFALVEEEHASNDDKILTTALALSKALSKESSCAGRCYIRTENVLITTDRNLRVKALSRNLAVSELSEFLQWAKNGRT